MIRVLTFINLLLLFMISCNNKKKTEGNIAKDKQYYSSYEDDGLQDGTYCAEVEYYNPSTGTRNTYALDVDVEGGELVLIHWSNSGWLDDSHFSPEDITSGECEFVSDKGYRYTIVLGDFGGCGHTDDYKIRNDVNDEVTETTCPKCGDEKDQYDDYCYSCQRKIKEEEENKCKKCGGELFGAFDELCNKCKEEEEIDQ